MTSINDILKLKLMWRPIPESERDFSSENFSKEECFLRINNFPEEPLWTLFYKNASIDFDDTPENWEIKYRSETKKE